VVIATSEMITDRELAQAASPEDFGILSDGQRSWSDVGNKPASSVEPTSASPSRGAQESSVEPAAPEPTEEAIKDESVSVKDILKTLSERSGRRGTTGFRTGTGREAQKAGAEPSASQPTVELPGEERIDVEEIPPSPQMPRREKINEQAGVREAVRPSVAGVGPTEREKTGEETDIDAVLRSLSERPAKGGQAGKEVAPALASQEAAGVEEPAGQEQMEERIDVDEVLNTLSERPRREKIGPPPVEGEVGIEEALKLLAEPGATEVPEKQIKRKGVSAPSAKPVAPEKEEAGRVEWIFQDGKWVPVQVGPPKPIEPVIGVERGEEIISPLEERKEKPVSEFEWEKAAKSQLIRIPSDKLLAGDPRYNIVIKPGDTIYVPVDIIGEFCIMGNVNNQGYVNITGRPMTLKMAVAAAGGLGPLAWPKTCEVIRRIGRKKEEIVLVDLDKIAGGEQPDFFIKPNDLINVGTHYSSIWRAILRNAFRATYGFGFVYDRNFADRDYGQFWP
jgi:hypothetical protein